MPKEEMEGADLGKGGTRRPEDPRRATTYKLANKGQRRSRATRWSTAGSRCGAHDEHGRGSSVRADRRDPLLEDAAGHTMSTAE